MTELDTVGTKRWVSHKTCTHSNTAWEREMCRDQEQRQDPAYARTEVAERILDYVTREFNEGIAGNRRALPSTRDVAKACVRGGGKAKSCRRALVHLNRLMWSGDIIRVKDDDTSPNAWGYVFWALPDSGRDIPVAITVSGLAAPLNRYGFTDEAWAAMKPWQRNSIRSIEMAEPAPSSW